MDSFTKSHPVEFIEHRNVSFYLFDLLATLKIEPTLKILEVGCSTGALPKIFLEHAAETKFPQKIEYVGVDPVAKYEKLTIGNNTLELITQDFLEFSSAPLASFSVILFTFSLHHLDMPKALEKAKALLHPNGLLFVDDFEREKIGPENGSWIFDILDILKAGGLYQEVKYGGHHHSPQESHDSHHHHDPHSHGHEEHKPVEHQENVGEPWRKFEVSSLPKSDTIIDEIKKHFTITTETHGGPQFFKFACKGLEKSARGALVAEEILKKENERIKRGLIYSVGFRVVAHK